MAPKWQDNGLNGGQWVKWDWRVLEPVCAYRGALVSPARQNLAMARLDAAVRILGPARAAPRSASTNAHELPFSNPRAIKNPHFWGLS